jgi:hypothetical protein
VSTRTQDEIVARFREEQDDDVFGWMREVLLEAMTAESLQAALPAVSAADAADVTSDSGPDRIEGLARTYLTFAVGKIVNHRGISATRSVQKLAGYAWVLGRDDIVTAMEAAGYAQYGAPKVKAFADGMGWPFLETAEPACERAWLERMSQGLRCSDACMDGCDR